MHTKIADLTPIRPFDHQLKQPEDKKFAQWIQKKTQISLEIGCGAGLHPLRWTHQNPNKTLIAIERTQDKYCSFQQRINNHQRENLWAVNADAHHWLPNNAGHLVFEDIYILYPNPYPKEKQANKRWHRNPFTHFLLQHLNMGGRIHCATNEKAFFEECLIYGEHFWKLKVLKAEPVAYDTPPRTHFEKKYLARGEACFDLIFQKIKDHP